MLVLKRLIKRNLFYDNLRQLNRQLVTILGLFFITKIRCARVRQHSRIDC